ncbi:MAG: glycoside hydrolase family 13 protein [Lachnospiraceae bacterium]|jgi:alpha-glucosidase|nr:glycoside hydrolase family 13 protein [Lachnospiraceae bacterium]
MDFGKAIRAEQNNHYISTMRPLFNRRALFSDLTEDFISPLEPNAFGRVTITFQTEKDNVDQVWLCSVTDKFMMMKTDTDDLLDYYEVEIQLEDTPFYYYFSVHSGKITCFYDRRGVVKELEPYYMMRIIPGFKTPDWAKGAVMYQIYVDRFFNGDPDNDVLTNEYHYVGGDVERVEDWNKYPASFGVREFYGGDLQGVIDKLDYLVELGIDAIYFNPLFVSPSNHKYDIQDYDSIDPHIGVIVKDEGDLLSGKEYENRMASRYKTRVTNKENLDASNMLFAKLVKEAHKRGIKVILDGVFNHCGSFNKWMDRERIYENALGYEKGAYCSADSPYRSYFNFMGSSNSDWPYNGKYDGWWGFDTLPKLNYEGSRDLFHYMMNIAAKWVAPPYNADGWRLDVAADLGHTPEFNHYFWKEFRKAVKRANPDAIILAEHYGSAAEWLNGDEWDTVMNYDAFMDPISWFLTGMQKHSDDYRADLHGNADGFWGAMQANMAVFSMPSLLVAMNELSNHDHSRFLTRTNGKVGRSNNLGPEAANEGIKKAVMREAVVIQMTWPGAPTIYYGDEAGLCGFTDPDNRRTYPWGNEDFVMITLHQELIRIHKENKEFLTGALRQLDSSHNFLAYARFTRQGKSIVLINNNDYEVGKDIIVWHLGIPRQSVMRRLILTDEAGFNVDSVDYQITSGRLSFVMPPMSAMILRYQEEDCPTKKSVGRIYFRFDKR